MVAKDGIEIPVACMPDEFMPRFEGDSGGFEFFTEGEFASLNARIVAWAQAVLYTERAGRDLNGIGFCAEWAGVSGFRAFCRDGFRHGERLPYWVRGN